MILTPEERKRFCEYLRADIASNEALTRQMEGLGPLMDVVKSRYKFLVSASKVVLANLEAVETFEVHG